MITTEPDGALYPALREARICLASDCSASACTLALMLVTTVSPCVGSTVVPVLDGDALRVEPHVLLAVDTAQHRVVVVLEPADTDGVGVDQARVLGLVGGGDLAGVAEHLRGQRSAGVARFGDGVDRDAGVLLDVLLDGQDDHGARIVVHGDRCVRLTGRARRGHGGRARRDLLRQQRRRHVQQRAEPSQDRARAVGPVEVASQDVAIDGDDLLGRVGHQRPALIVDDQPARRGDGHHAVVRRLRGLYQLVRVEQLDVVEPDEQRGHQRHDQHDHDDEPARSGRSRGAAAVGGIAQVRHGCPRCGSPRRPGPCRRGRARAASRCAACDVPARRPVAPARHRPAWSRAVG